MEATFDTDPASDTFIIFFFFLSVAHQLFKSRQDDHNGGPAEDMDAVLGGFCSLSCLLLQLFFL